MTIVDPYVAAAAAKSSGRPDAARADAVGQAFAELLGKEEDSGPGALLSEITRDGIAGYWAWQVEQLRRRIAGEVMDEMDVTEDKLRTLPPEERAQIQEKILREVERRLELAMKEKEKEEEGRRKDDPLAGPVRRQLLEFQELAG